VIPGYIEKDKFLKILKYMHLKCYEDGININDYIEGKVDCDKE
jgi:thioredoxin-related protein